MAAGTWILFADMDGTILDKATYEPGPALQALQDCLESGVPVVLNSSKTRAEMEFFYQRLPLVPGAPFVSENGGGLFFPLDHWDCPPGGEKKGLFWKVTLGSKHEPLMKALKEGVKALGIQVFSFSEMAPEELAHHTGLPLEQAGLAREREFDEPFLIPDVNSGTIEALRRFIEEQGLRFTRGGRCYHVHGNADKGSAVGVVMEQYRAFSGGTIASAAVGDAVNDLPLLRAVDRAYLVQRDDGTHDPDIPRGQGIVFVEGRGPEGFRRVVSDLLGKNALR